MKQLEIVVAKEELEEKLDVLFLEMNKIHISKDDTLQEKVNILNNIRLVFYENINQYQHENLLIRTAEHLQKKHEINKWNWHPNQTGRKDEADLEGYKGDEIIVRVEVTTSQNPIGRIDTIMRDTLDKLDNMKSTNYYVVQTDRMFQRAKSKVKNRNLNINVIKYKNEKI